MVVLELAVPERSVNKRGVFVEWVLPLRHEALTPLFLALSALGDTLFYLVALAIGYWLLERTLFRRLAFLVVLTALLNFWLKVSFAVPRPTEISWLTAAEGFSFPSGHAQLAAVAWLWLAFSYRRAWLYGLAALMILGIAASRVYLGVHTPRDVGAGILVGALSVLLAWRLLHRPPEFWQKCPPWLRATIWVLAVALSLIFFLGELDHVAIVSSGALLGFQIGFLFERDRGGRLLPGWRRLAAVVLGLSVALALRILGKILLPAAGLPIDVTDFLRYFLIALWVIWLAPRTFERLGLATQTRPQNQKRPG